jgi:hypothetical protein
MQWDEGIQDGIFGNVCLERRVPSDLPLPAVRKLTDAGWRPLLARTLTNAVNKHYLPYNPFTGIALTVRKGEAPPVDRSEFFITTEQFRWMMNDPVTPGHVKMMILLAYTAVCARRRFLP